MGEFPKNTQVPLQLIIVNVYLKVPLVAKRKLNGRLSCHTKAFILKMFTKGDAKMGESHSMVPRWYKKTLNCFYLQTLSVKPVVGSHIQRTVFNSFPTELLLRPKRALLICTLTTKIPGRTSDAQIHANLTYPTWCWIRKCDQLLQRDITRNKHELYRVFIRYVTCRTRVCADACSTQKDLKQTHLLLHWSAQNHFLNRFLKRSKFVCPSVKPFFFIFNL